MCRKSDRFVHGTVKSSVMYSVINCHHAQSNLLCISHGSFVFSKLAIQSRKTTDSPAAMCWGENEDYFECIHGFKEKAHKLQVIEEKTRREGLGTRFDIHSDSMQGDFYSKALTAEKIREKTKTEE